MEYRKLGRTGIKVSEIGFGTIPILKGNVSILTPYYNLTTTEAIKIMEKAFENGCNFFDTAAVPEYGDSEIKIGIFLKKHFGEIFISDKARAYTGKQMALSLKNSFKNLGKDFCDIYFIHQVSPENEYLVYKKNGALNFLQRFKEKGYLRAIGIATHHFKIAYRAVQDARIDVLQVTGNIFERGILDRVEQNNMFNKVGLIVHKALAGGVLTHYFSIKELIEFVLTYKVSSVLVGMGMLEHVISASDYNETNDQRLSFKDTTKRLNLINPIIPCDRCQKCKCINSIEIESLFRYNNYYYMGHKIWAYNKLAKLDFEIFNKCFYCRDKKCLNQCPRQINIKEEIKKIFLTFKGDYKKVVNKY